VPASPGTGVGPVVFDSARAEAVAEGGVTPVLLCPTTSPQDINGMIVAAGIVTGLGGRASHAAVVARGMGKPAVCGIETMTIERDAGRAVFSSGEQLVEGDLVTVDGDSGRLLAGSPEFTEPVANEWTAELLGWCDRPDALPVLTEAPPGATRVTSAEDDVPEQGAIVVDVPWEGADSAAILTQTCRTVFEHAAASAEVYLALPAELAGIDFQPPAGRWAGVVAPHADDWASRLLALRLTWLRLESGGG
jgi:phosphohistidine swiveling domain-containing protein